jgi:hypothetical protein
MGAVFGPTKPGSAQALGDYWVDPGTGVPYFWNGTRFVGPSQTISINQFGVVASNWAVTGYEWVCPQNQVWIPRSATTRYKTAGGSGCTLGFTVDDSGANAGAGTAILSADFDMTATADTPYNGAMAAAMPVLSAGKALSKKIGGTVTGLADCTAVVVLERLS